ncbi:relaxin receptor 2-like isoform X1 [Zophobas morio]
MLWSPLFLFSVILLGRSQGARPCLYKVIREELSLNDCNLTEFDPEKVSSPESVKTIGLSGNSIKEVSKEMFMNFVSLTLLDLRKNRITKIEDGALENLGNLKFLFLQKNNLESVNKKMFKRLSGLEQLTLQGNSLKFVGNETFSGMPNLYFLLLWNNKIKYINDKTLLGLLKLEILDLSKNLIESIPSYAFSKLSSLTNLNLRDNPIRFIGHIAFYDSEFVHISQEKFLCCARISYKNDDHISQRCTNESRFYLPFNKESCPHSDVGPPSENGDPETPQGLHPYVNSIPLASSKGLSSTLTSHGHMRTSAHSNAQSKTEVLVKDPTVNEDSTIEAPAKEYSSGPTSRDRVNTSSHSNPPPETEVAEETPVYKEPQKPQFSVFTSQRKKISGGDKAISNSFILLSACIIALLTG